MTDLIEEVRSSRRLPTPEVQRLILEAADVAVQRVAAELGVHRVTVSRWLCGTRRPRGQLLVRYLDLLNAIRAEVEL